MTPQVGVPFVDWVLSLLNDWGYLIVFGFTIAENLFVVGSFVPGETIVMAAGFVTVKGGLDPWLVFVASVLGTTAGSNISYYFGRRGGRGAIERWGGKVFDDERILAAEEYFYKHGSKTIYLARFAAVFKNFAPAIAGMARMRLAVFELYTVLGAITYTTLMVVLGRVFANNFDRALAIARDITWAGSALLVGLIVAVWWARRRYEAARVARLAEEAEKVAGEVEDAEP